jgi:hypothetical protein
MISGIFADRPCGHPHLQEVCMISKFARRGLVSAGIAALLLAAPASRLRADDAASTAPAAPAADDKGADNGDKMEGKMLEHMTKALDLTDDEVAKVKAEGESNRAAMKPLRDKVKLDMDSLKVLVDKKASDSDLSAAIATFKTDRKAVEAQQSAHMDALQAILTPMQQAKGIFMMARMEGMGHGGWGGHRGKGDKGGMDGDKGPDAADGAGQPVGGGDGSGK